MDKTKVLEVIEKMRAVREAKGYSYQKIADMTEATGEPSVSVSTVKRVFSCEGKDCKWSTVRTIAIALLGVGFDTPEPDAKDAEQPHRYYAQIEGLKALVEAKGELMAQKDEQIAYLRAELNRYRKVVWLLGSVCVLLLAVAVLL